ncbi:hypothetical protein BDN71DRAFT_1446448 [Pleurotus eryngii]|uniref:Uncharacterized protein n=1 Tax=Pleurotus eryngii TaxID=5323 RepID=A0A9P5ZYC4_PLEER|nr:hypothetical protein BDN71DRAFT_1446448 [Pleurotus eryngii]
MAVLLVLPGGATLVSHFRVKHRHQALIRWTSDKLTKGHAMPKPTLMPMSTPKPDDPSVVTPERQVRDCDWAVSVSCWESGVRELSNVKVEVEMEGRDEVNRGPGIRGGLLRLSRSTTRCALIVLHPIRVYFSSLVLIPHKAKRSSRCPMSGRQNWRHSAFRSVFRCLLSVRRRVQLPPSSRFPNIEY